MGDGPLTVAHENAPNSPLRRQAGPIAFGALKNRRREPGRRWLKLLAVVVALFEVTTVLALQAHYTMDLFTAVIAALYVAYVAERISPSLDHRLAKLVECLSRCWRT